MPRIRAEGYIVDYDEQNWRLSKITRNLRTTTSSLGGGYLFEAIRGNPVINYTPEYAQASNLPGTTISLRYIRTVLVGYQEQSKYWILGMHLARTPEEKPAFRALVQWNNPEDGETAKAAARALAGVLGVPLNIYGDKKAPTPSRDTNRSGVTGPIDPHNRLNISYDQVVLTAHKIALPVQGNGFTLAQSSNGLVLKLSKSNSKGKVETPVFNLCEINTKSKQVKLVPPTGLLGAFTRDRSRELFFHTIFNVEYRIIHTNIIQKKGSDRGGVTEEITPVHMWGIYLTLKDESLLLLQASYNESLKLRQAKNELVGSSKLETNSAEGLKYFREQLEEKETMENFATQIEQVAYCLASAVEKHLVKTEVSG